MAVGVLDPRKGIVWQDNGSSLTPEQIEQLQALEIRKRMGDIDTSPVNHWTQGAARVVDALGGVLRERRINNAASENQSYNQELASPLIDALSGASTPSPMASASTSGVAQEMAQTSPAPTVDISGDKETFVASLLPAAIEESKRTGVDPRIIVAQAAQETGWGRSAPGNNYFGIKSHGQGGGQKLATHEYIDGKRVNVNDSFRTFESPADSVRGYGDFILKNPRYEALRTAQGLDGQLQALQASGYATDPNYSRSVGAIARGIRLPETPAAAIEAAAPVSGFRGSDYNSPMLTYDDRGARVERPYTDPVVSVQPQGMAPQGFDASRFGETQASPMMAAPEVYSAQTDFAPELAPPVNIGPSPAVAAVQQPQVAPQPQAQAPATNTAAIAQALRVMSDPRANEGTRRVAQVLLQQEQQKQAAAQEQSIWQQRQDYQQQLQNSDPLRQAQLQKLQQETANPNSDESFYGNPIAVQQPDGKVAYGQIGNRGTFKPITLSEGQSFAPPTRSIDAGTETILTDQAGNVISRIPKQNREAAAETAAGSVEGKTTAERSLSAPSDYQGAQNAIDILDQIEKSPALEVGTGFSSVLNSVPGTAGYDFQNIVEQAKSGAFLTAIENLRGLGSLSNAEGGAATAAITRMDTATSTPAFLAALSDYRKIVTQGLDRAKRNMPEGKMPPQAIAPQKRLKYNPATGELE